MAAFNFPDAPSIGQLHPASPQVGIPQYQWNGSEWVTPQYNPLTYVLKAGDTMLGALNVVTPPTQAAHAASKAYVDAYATGAAVDALAYSGIQINGAFEVSQELGMAGSTTSFFCDGWRVVKSGTMVINGVIAAVPNYFPGFPFVGLCQATTAQGSLGASDYANIMQFIEGYRISRLGWGFAGAKPITIAFWSSHTLSGVYSVCIRNGDFTRSYATTYTHAVGNTQQYNVITIPGCTDGVWNTVNASGLSIVFSMASGTTFIVPSANTWLNGNYLAAPGQVNGVATVSNLMRLGGVLILPGIYAPTAAQSPLITRSYGEELAVCQRYFQWVPISFYWQAANASEGLGFPATFNVPMRAVPTLGAIAGDPGGGAGTTNISTCTIRFATHHGVQIWAINTSIGLASVTYYRASADARL